MKRIKRKTIKVIMVILGCCFILAAAAFKMNNYNESEQAGKEADKLSTQLQEMLDANAQSADSRDGDDPSLGMLDIDETEGISTVKVGEYSVCGTISIPSIGIELAVIDDWSYSNLHISANRFYGSPDKQLMIMAHNYARHFGKINQLSLGDEVIFTDMQGVAYHYVVSETTLLATDQLNEIVAGKDWDLTLFTCTYGGANRVVVRCSLVK